MTIWYPASPSRIALWKTQSSIAIKSRKKKEIKGNKNRSRRQILAKCCSVSLQSWMNQWNCSEVKERAQGLGKIFNYWLLNLTVVAAGVEVNEFEMDPFAQRSHHVLVWSNWRQNKSFNLNVNVYAVHCNWTTEVRNISIHNLTFLTQTTKRSCSQFRARGRNRKSNTQTTVKAI